MTTPEILAALARMADHEDTARRATGEPCACPEQQLDCICGAYEAAR